MNATAATHEFTADDFRAMATQCREERAASWERSDSDGFLSQWANQRMENTYLDAAKVAENGYTVERVEIFTTTGEHMESEQRDGDYGFYWFIPKADGKARFFTESKAQNRKVAVTNNAKKGYYIGCALWNVTIDSMGRREYVDIAEIVDNGQTELAELGLI